MRFLKKFVGFALIAVGLALFLYPYAAEWIFNYQTAAYVEAFDEQYKTGGSEDDTEPETVEETSGSPADTDSLYRQCLAYNQKIYEEEQSGLVDAWSYEQAAIEVNADAFGYIEIPAMDLVMPLYLGATEENMAKGAVVLGQTSIPIGGENTNAVIAGHRGYRGSPYFREIEKLSIGDAVYITNQWGTLTYTVTGIDIISPSNKEAIKIQEGKDMVTLITCHPYRSHGKQRYVVYCERSDGSESVGEGTESGTGDNGAATMTASDGRIYELSENDINREKQLRLACAAAIVFMFTVILLRSVYSRWKSKHRRKEGLKQGWEQGDDNNGSN